MDDYTEHFICNDCGETFVHTGSNACPFCESENIQPEEPEDDVPVTNE